MKVDIPDTVKRIMNQINQSSHNIYLIGGAVRDQFLGLESNDYDLCTDMSLEEIKNIFPSFTIMNENDHRNTGILRIGDQVIEISSYHGNSIEEDLSNRDLTINAIACDSEGNIIDPFNGVNDIQNKKISLVNKEGKGIDVDPLRILRVLRFSSIYDYEIDDNTKNIIHTKKELLQGVAKERIYKELCKILVSPNATKILREYKDIFSEIIPEISSMIGFEQHNDYHVYDVFEHTLKVVENTPPILPLRLAALFHDIGKPSCYKEDEKEVGHFLGHEYVSSTIFEEFARKYKLDYKTKNLVSKLILYHDRELSTKSNKINQFFINFGIDNMDLLFLLREADIKGQNPKYSGRLQLLSEIYKLYKQKASEKPCISIKDLQMNGRKLMEMGFFDKKIGIILKDVLDKVTNELLDNNEEDISDYVTSHYNKAG